MSIKTFCSCYVPLANVSNAPVLLDDHVLFNQMIRGTLCIKMREMAANAAAKAAGTPPAKGSPGGGKRKAGAQSIHTFLKDTTHTTDYFVTAVESDVSGIISGAKEALDYQIKLKKECIEQFDRKIASLDKQISNQRRIKEALISREKAICEGKTPSKFKGYPGHPYRVKERSDGSLEIRAIQFGKKKSRKPSLTFPNEYLFETLYLDPKIRSLKSRRAMILSRRKNTEDRLKALERRRKNGNYPYRLVSYGKMRKWFSLPQAEQRRLFLKHRERDMLIPGRHDAKQGSWVVKYNSVTGELFYRSADGKQQVQIPGVLFAYGQEEVNKVVNASKADQRSVAWAFHLSSGKVQVRCTVDIPESPYKNFSTADGVVSIDKNYNNIAVAETNAMGQLIGHKVLCFDPEGKSKGQYEALLSMALEEVFQECVDKKKPLVCEGIRSLRKRPLYQQKKKNRHVSLFAYDKMEQLIQSKSNKYDVAVLPVNPANTSQIGRHKYARMYGLSKHEAAALAIGRRGMGCKERIPKEFKALVPSKMKSAPYIKQWKALNNPLKSYKPAKDDNNLPF